MQVGTELFPHVYRLLELEQDCAISDPEVDPHGERENSRRRTNAVEEEAGKRGQQGEEKSFWDEKKRLNSWLLN